MAPKILWVPPLIIEKFSFGYKDLLADIFWLRTIQDFDYCEERTVTLHCKEQGWLSQMLNLITDLAPKYRIVYATGGLALSVLISDVEGARLFYEKAAKAFPYDWPILYRAAYHNLYEVKNKDRAAEFLVQAGKAGAPPWVFSLAAKLYTEEGKIQLGETLLKDLESQSVDPAVIEKMRTRINEAKKQTSTD